MNNANAKDKNHMATIVTGVVIMLLVFALSLLVVRKGIK